MAKLFVFVVSFLLVLNICVWISIFYLFTAHPLTVEVVEIPAQVLKGVVIP